MIDTAKFKTPEQIAEELSSVEKGESRSWGSLFLLLDSIEQHRCLQQDGASFTNWVERNAWRLHKSPAILWRILSAGRFVRELDKRFKGGDLVVPSLEEMPDAVSPENIELLCKLDRVLPDDKFAESVRRVFAGEAKRSELRGVWETYRPVLGGKTARGRGVVAPRLDKRDPEQYQSQAQAATLDAFQAAGPGWIGVKSPSNYKVFVHVNPEVYRVPSGTYLFAAVVVVKPKNGSTQYHGIRFLKFSRSPESYEKALAYCDRLWVFSHSTSYGLLDHNDHSTVPSSVGILEVKNGSVSVIKPAGIVEGAGVKRVELASALLIRALATK